MRREVVMLIGLMNVMGVMGVDGCVCVYELYFTEIVSEYLI